MTAEPDQAIATVAAHLKKHGYSRVVILPNGRANFSPADQPLAGLYGKYFLSKSDGSPIDPAADYFVLRIDPGGDSSQQARIAVRIYAELIKCQAYRNEELANDLIARLSQHEGGHRES